MTSPARHDESPQPVAGVLAFLLPGLGHAFLGEPRRGLLIAVGVLSLFFGGMLIGGIDVVDRREDFWWFAGQAGVGPIAFGVDWVHQSQFKVHEPNGAVRSPLPGEEPHKITSLAKVNEIGALYAALAGLLNVIAIIDASWHAPRRARTPAGGRP